MNGYLGLKKANCKNCYKCIRHCPVKSIRFSDHQAHIIEEDCILCGMCFVSCPQNAKIIRNDIAKVKALLQEKQPVYVSIAPSFVANYEGATIETLRKALQQLGFADVEETAIGATMVKQQYELLVADQAQPVIISTCCHTVNLLVQKYYPEALPFMAKVISPMQAHCQTLKAKHANAHTVFIGPCISKKAEAEDYPGIVDVVLTFEELTEWLQEADIALERGVEHIEMSKARLFPTVGGILQTMDCTSKTYRYLAIDGVEQCMAAFEEIIKGNLANCFIEMSACIGSCIGGPGMDQNQFAPLRKYLAVKASAGATDFAVAPRSASQMYKAISSQKYEKDIPSHMVIEEILHKMGKMTKAQELNCGSCGYNTCRDKALALYQGKADLSMCLPFLKEKAESFSDNIINNTPNGILVLNEALEIQLINTAACAIMNIKRPKDVIGEPVIRILDPVIYLKVLNDGQNIIGKRGYLAEYQKYIEQTIIYDRSYQVLMIIMRDVTTEEIERNKKESISRQTIEITDKVIEKQMRAVQEIASLLGETTAETKIALAKLKESLDNE